MGPAKAHGPGSAVSFAGQLDLGFISFVDKTGLQRPQNYTDPIPRHIQMDPTHFAAAVDSLLQNPLNGSRDVNIGEGGGWAGDFVQFVGTWVAAGRQDIDQYTKDNLFLKASSGFGPDDFFEDIDGWLIAWYGPLSSVLTSEAPNRVLLGEEDVPALGRNQYRRWCPESRWAMGGFVDVPLEYVPVGNVTAPRAAVGVVRGTR